MLVLLQLIIFMNSWTQHPTEWVPGALPTGIKPPDLESHHYLNQESRLNMRGTLTPRSLYAFLACIGQMILLPLHF